MNSEYWFDRVNDAWSNKKPRELPRMKVTSAEYEMLRREAKPWNTLPDGRQMWGGVVVEVVG